MYDSGQTESLFYVCREAAKVTIPGVWTRNHRLLFRFGRDFPAAHAPTRFPRVAPGPLHFVMAGLVPATHLSVSIPGISLCSPGDFAEASSAYFSSTFAPAFSSW